MENDVNWQMSLREARFTEAAARARLAGAAPDAMAALEDLAEVERMVKAKRYGPARRALKRYQDNLDGVSDLSLRALVNVDALEHGVVALEETERARLHESAVLRERLAPALAHPVTRAEAHNALGVLQALQNDAQAARAAFDDALEADPRHYRALTNIGNLLLEEGDPVAAEGYYRRALELNAEYAGAHHNLAVALRRQRKIAASVRSLKTGQRLMARQSNRDGREEARERFGRLGAPESTRKLVRWVLIAMAVLIVFYLLRGGA
ncbi:tetratricopeptide repeat protein [Deinococcus peraridilitoris]|nr:tetratricopeptide repeat protein [Deinococcus peraridilitoris]